MQIMFFLKHNSCSYKKKRNKIGTLGFLFTFNPEAIYSGLTDIKLMNGDVIQFFSKDEIQDILDSQEKNSVNL